jgi:CheY-like chemotaxis protein
MKVSSSAARSVRVLLLGDFTPAEFQPVAEEIRQLADVETVANCGAAESRLQSGNIPPDLIVVAQLWPGQHLHMDLDRVQRAAPLSRLIALGGSWCEGQQRSGTPWPGMLRTYWHSWLAHWRRDFLRLSVSQLPSWGLPIVATDDERALFCHIRAKPKRELIAVRSHCFDMADMLVSVCRRQGYAAVWLDPLHPPRVDGPAAVLWEGNPRGFDDLRAVRGRYPQIPLLALLDFPRWEDVERAKQIGAVSVLAKPLSLDDLFGRLVDILDGFYSNKNSPSLDVA